MNKLATNVLTKIFFSLVFCVCERRRWLPQLASVLILEAGGPYLCSSTEWLFCGKRPQNSWFMVAENRHESVLMCSPMLLQLLLL